MIIKHGSQYLELEFNLTKFEKLIFLSTERGKLIEERADVELQIKNLTEQRTASKDLKNLTRKIVETTEKLAKMNSKVNLCFIIKQFVFYIMWVV